MGCLKGMLKRDGQAGETLCRVIGRARNGQEMNLIGVDKLGVLEGVLGTR